MGHPLVKGRNKEAKGKIKIKNKSKSKIKGDGQEYASYTRYFFGRDSGGTRPAMR